MAVQLRALLVQANSGVTHAASAHFSGVALGSGLYGEQQQTGRCWLKAYKPQSVLWWLLLYEYWRILEKALPVLVLFVLQITTPPLAGI